MKLSDFVGMHMWLNTADMQGINPGSLIGIQPPLISQLKI